MTKSQNIVRGAFFIVTAEVSFALSAALIKLVSDSLPNQSIVFFRNLFGLLILTPLLLNAGENILKTNRLHLHLFRSGIGMGAMYCFFYALANLPLADSMLIKSTIPLIIPFISLAWLKESISKRIIVAGLLGFIGVFVILNPDGNNTNWAILVALSSSLMAALAFVTVRQLSSTEPPLRIVTYFAIVGLIISAIPLTWTWQTPTFQQCVMLLGVGLTTTIGQLLLTRGYQNAPASSVGIFTYTSVPFGTFLGWLFWQELLEPEFYLGAILIILAGVLVLRKKLPSAINN
ncbi:MULTISPECIES: DMT family transporter [Crocosphaera]|uniref:Permease of the drug/metabolite transporter (DMT) superfamily n=1 Tax=Crocosphaera watsonii WH 8502 TaxID=423474 RepID=T2IL13_CROWT|nr:MULTISPECIES: DMT family transporter [Crocosphaera]NQZ62255.1 DMT family transporter [Crocosphaera sp.]CCQ53614.1 Permease of the drug/metabolite transporter (DMT) superfamily [Crocosphaera watsonii WH 8502]